MVDIDFFNDYYGHLQGDEVLTKVAALLDEILEKYNAFAARWGGDFRGSLQLKYSSRAFEHS
jgi:diguanylate cyclase (GGDEF)-like protein